MTTQAQTEKLYWSDPHLASFETTSIVTMGEHNGKPSLIVDRTLFYPEGGGQLGDSGSIVLRSGGAESQHASTGEASRRPGWDDRRSSTISIADTQIDDAGVIHHVLEIPAAAANVIAAGEPVSVKGTIDIARRRDHMAQHTGQHALSRALADVARAETVSARLGATSCTIDVARPGIPDADLHKAEDLVNALIRDNLDVKTLYPSSAEELAKLPLRKQPKVAEGSVIRIIEIDGFDMTPCGGTHCTRTGQIGQARIVGLEKYKGMLRITFHAGLRALDDARAKHEALSAIATDLTCGAQDVRGAVSKLRASLKDTRAQLDVARAELADLVARAALDRLPAAAPGKARPIIIPILRPNDDVGSLRTLAGKLATGDGRVLALTAVTDAATGGELVVVVQRGSSLTQFDCGAFIQAQAKERGGRGGGRPERAEGRFPRGTTLEILTAAAEAVLGA